MAVTSFQTLPGDHGRRIDECVSRQLPGLGPNGVRKVFQNRDVKLDGVRVYNPVEAGSAAESAQADAGEGNTLYLNLHDLLLNADQGFSVLPVADMSDEARRERRIFINMANNLNQIARHFNTEGANPRTVAELEQLMAEIHKQKSL